MKTKEEILKQIADLQEELQNFDILEIPKSFVPEHGEDFYVPYNNNAYNLASFVNEMRKLLRISNLCFRTQKEADTMQIILEDVKEFQEYVFKLQGDWKADWSNHQESKHIIYLSRKSSHFYIETIFRNNYFLFSFKDANIAQSVIDKFGNKLHHILKFVNGN